MDSAILNRLRAAVLGANDGIISVATALIVLVGVFPQQFILLTAISVTLAGAVSMAAGEYVSVGAQRDNEIAHGAKHLTSPVQAAAASFLSFLAGSLIPAVVGVLTGSIVGIVIAVLVALVLTSLLSSKGTAKAKRSTVRMVVVGSLSLTVGVVANIVLRSLNI